MKDFAFHFVILFHPLTKEFTVRIHRKDLYVFDRDGKRIYAGEEVEKAYAEFKRNW